MRLPSFGFPGRAKPDEIPPEAVEQALPIVWMLGKTGAGKSSIVRVLTGLSDVEIGSGYATCTKTSERFDFPADAPLVRFLDTRGLGEAGYDPAADLAACEGHSHAVMVVARLDDPVQGEVAEALGAVLRRRPKLPVLLVHTGADLMPDDAACRARAATAALFARQAGAPLRDVTVALPPDGSGSEAARAALVEELLDLLPAAGLLLARSSDADAEQLAFDKVRNRVLFYAGLAGTSDVAPLVGFVSVPSAQAAMLHELARRYGTQWNRATMASFLGTLGAGAVVKVGASFGLRQLAKLIPVYGQTVGAAVSGGVSFATTYAIGRVAAKFLHGRSTGAPPSAEELRAAYRDALTRASRNDR